MALHEYDTHNKTIRKNFWKKELAPSFLSEIRSKCGYIGRRCIERGRRGRRGRDRQQLPAATARMRTTETSEVFVFLPLSFRLSTALLNDSVPYAHGSFFPSILRKHILYIAGMKKFSNTPFQTFFPLLKKTKTFPITKILRFSSFSRQFSSYFHLSEIVFKSYIMFRYFSYR